MSGGILAGGILSRGDFGWGDFVRGDFVRGDIVRGDFVRGDFVLEPRQIRARGRPLPAARTLLLKVVCSCGHDFHWRETS